MNCPECGAETSHSHITCRKCGVALPTPHRRPSGILKSPKWKKHLFLWGAIFALVVVPCLFMADLFCTPRDVIVSRRGFDSLRKSYYAKPTIWKEKKETICAWIDQRKEGAEITWEEGTIPLEVFMAYLVDRLDLSPNELEDVALFPGGDPESKRLILSKHEKGFTPIPIILSLEMELTMENGDLTPNFISLKRGKRNVPTALAWVYFGPELQLLGCLKPIATEVKRIQAAESLPNYSTDSSSLSR